MSIENITVYVIFVFPRDPCVRIQSVNTLQVNGLLIVYCLVNSRSKPRRLNVGIFLLIY